MAAGGNTACVEVVAGDTRIILDAGTGLRTLGNERMAQGMRHSTILLSHLHWDHVAGLQFFTPVYVPGSSRRDRERSERRDVARRGDPLAVPGAVLPGRLR